jgi:iron complex outermembrane receptor protein
LGVRWETFRLDDSSASALPVVKAGINYQAGRNNWLRASFGQGYRFPSVAERFVDTDVGDLIYIFPNPDLQPEVGWNAEIGTKQVVNIGQWQGFLDLAGFWTEYSDMTEFVFGIYQDGVGFKNQNIGQARIAGLEFTASGQGSIGKVPLQILGGYTYVYPANLSADTTLANPGKFLEFFWKNFDSEDEEVLSTLLSYRFRHVAKLDLQSGYGRFTVGVDLRYFSFMDKIDQVFGVFIPGVSDFRARNNGGDWIMGLRASADIGEYGNLTVLVNNVMNREYSLRPARMDAPRNLSVQYRVRF